MTFLSTRRAKDEVAAVFLVADGTKDLTSQAGHYPGIPE